MRSAHVHAQPYDSESMTESLLPILESAGHNMRASKEKQEGISMSHRMRQVITAEMAPMLSKSPGTRESPYAIAECKCSRRIDD